MTKQQEKHKGNKLNKTHQQTTMDKNYKLTTKMHMGWKTGNMENQNQYSDL